MKTFLTLFAAVFFCSESMAQDEYDTLFMIHNVWVNAKEQSCSFNQREAAMFDDYRVFAFYVDGETLHLSAVQTDYYYSDEEEEAEDCLFKICKLTNDEFVLYPLNSEAISLIDVERELYAEPRPTLYKSYLKDLKAAGTDKKKRGVVMSNYKTKYGLDADTMKFVPKSAYFEAVKIDSVDVSLSWTDQFDDKDIIRTQYNDLRWVPGSGKYYFGYRFKDAKIPVQHQGEGLQFVPPVVVDREMSDEPVQLKETAQDSLMRILDEAPAGWYTGKFDPTGMLLLETSLQTYGLNKPHIAGKKEDSYYSVRVYHEGKFTDFYAKGENASCLQENFIEFVENWTHYVRTFEACKSQAITFPAALSK